MSLSISKLETWIWSLLNWICEFWGLLIHRWQLRWVLSTYLRDNPRAVSSFHVGFGYKSGAGRTVSHQMSTWTQGTCCQLLCSWQWLRPAACIQPLQFLLSLLIISWSSVALRDLEMRELTQDSSLPCHKWAMLLPQPGLLVSPSYPTTQFTCVMWAIIFLQTEYLEQRQSPLNIQGIFLEIKSKI